MHINCSLGLREAYLCRRGLWDISAEQGAAERPQRERSYMAQWHCFGVCHALGWHRRQGKRAAEIPAGATSCTLLTLTVPCVSVCVGAVVRPQCQAWSVPSVQYNLFFQSPFMVVLLRGFICCPLAMPVC